MDGLIIENIRFFSQPRAYLYTTLNKITQVCLEKLRIKLRKEKWTNQAIEYHYSLYYLSIKLANDNI